MTITTHRDDGSRFTTLDKYELRKLRQQADDALGGEYDRFARVIVHLLDEIDHLKEQATPGVRTPGGTAE